MTKRNPVTGGKRSRFEQRILHSRYLLLHGFERLTDHRGTHFAGTQVTHFLDLQEIEKRIGLGRGYQSGLFPSCQLTRREPQVCEADLLECIDTRLIMVLSHIIGKVTPGRKPKLDGNGI